LIPDSLAISMLMSPPRSLGPLARTAGMRPPRPTVHPPATDVTVPYRPRHRARSAGLIGGVCVHDVAHEPVPDHVVAGQPDKLNGPRALGYLLAPAAGRWPGPPAGPPG